MIKLLLDAGIDAGARNERGETPLITFMKHRTYGDAFGEDPVEFLMESLELLVGATTQLSATDNEGRTALHVVTSARGGHKPTLRAAAKLLVEKGIRLDAQDNAGGDSD